MSDFGTLLELYGFGYTIDSIDTFYRALIPQLFEGLDTTMELQWRKVGGRFQATFVMDELEYVMYVEEMNMPTKLAAGVPVELRCINLGFSLVSDGVEHETLQNHLNTSSIKVFSVVVNGFKQILPVIIERVKPDVLMLAVSANELGRLNLYARFLRNLKFEEYKFSMTATDKDGNKILIKTKIPQDRHDEIKNGLKALTILKD